MASNAIKNFRRETPLQKACNFIKIAHLFYDINVHLKGHHL